jgi:L-ascorbate metabolism protein UlaG (beta-lactamase superfamily)
MLMQHIPHISWLGHAGFFLEDVTNGNRVYCVDPFELTQTELAKADLLFITHAHPDHLSPIDIKKIIKPNCIAVAPKDCLNRIQINEAQKFPIVPHMQYTINNFVFETVPAYNIKAERLTFHPKENNWVGYIFHLNNQQIYHAGDTDFIPEMRSLKEKNLDVAILPIGGHYCMGVEEAIEAANHIAAKVTIPMHYKKLVGDKHSIMVEQFKHQVTNSQVVVLEELP